MICFQTAAKQVTEQNCLKRRKATSLYLTSPWKLMPWCNREQVEQEKRINGSILLQGPKTRLSRIKVVDIDVIAERDLDTELGNTSWVGFMNAPQLFCNSPVKLFLFSNHSSFAFTSVNSGEQPVPPPLINAGCFLEQNRVLLKRVLTHNMDAGDRLRSIFKAQLHI